MSYRVVLTADNKEELNKLIDDKLKEGYLLAKGMYVDENNTLSQLMTLSNNIDGEITLVSGIKLVIFIAVMISITILIL